MYSFEVLIATKVFDEMPERRIIEFEPMAVVGEPGKEGEDIIATCIWGEMEDCEDGVGVESDIGEVRGEAVVEGEGVFGVDFVGFLGGFEEMGGDGLGDL